MRQESPELPGERPQHGRPLVQGHGLPVGVRHRARQLHPFHVIEAERALAFEGPPRHPAKGTVGKSMTKRAAEALVIVLSLTVAAAPGGAKEQAGERWRGVEGAGPASSLPRPGSPSSAGGSMSPTSSTTGSRYLTERGSHAGAIPCPSRRTRSSPWAPKRF